MSVTFTDAWHPTVNPSARMPIHHLRHVALLGRHDGLLNEFPRHRGGTTIRLPRPSGGGLDVIELPGKLAFAPWWLPADDQTAFTTVRDIYDRALRHPHSRPAERTAIAWLRDAYTVAANRPGRPTGLTVGEALWQAADELQRYLTPVLPVLSLTSLTRSPSRHLLAGALAHVPGGITQVMVAWARTERRTLWPMVAVTTSSEGVPLRVRLHANTGKLDISPLTQGDVRASRKPQPFTEEELIAQLAAGRLIPSARLSALAEVSLMAQGHTVRHFGNTYGNFATAGRLTGAKTAAMIPCCGDDEDSWHYADLPRTDGRRYPLHLLELATCTPSAHTAAADLIKASLSRGEPVHLELKGDLDAALRDGRARLLR